LAEGRRKRKGEEIVRKNYSKRMSTQEDQKSSCDESMT
jgi:hypothetical protein